MDNKLLTNKHTLVYLPGVDTVEAQYIKDNFCGNVVDNTSNVSFTDVQFYFIGDLSSVSKDLFSHDNVKAVEGLSYGLDLNKSQLVSVGLVPINVNNVGVYFRRVFNEDYFKMLKHQHQFQVITESIKPNHAFRKGIYLTEVTPSSNGDLLFHLLRCSSNLGGPTDGFKDVDRQIVRKANELSDLFFEQKANLNHVLAQIYDNHVEAGKQKKSKIKAHSDKTKDMPRNGLMAFCTFYDNLFNVDVTDESALTKLKFKLKNCARESHPELVEEFSITLYPGSVFIMSLDMNRYYTHEIKPSSLPVDKIPTRLGYVVRCSKTKALSRDGSNYILDHNNNDELIKMRKTTSADLDKIRHLYFIENTTTDIVDYESDGIIDCSMNDGDYIPPTF